MKNNLKAKTKSIFPISLRRRLIFNVNDINDLDPEFGDLPTGTEVYENEAIDKVVTTVRAEDPDVSNNTIR